MAGSGEEDDDRRVPLSSGDDEDESEMRGVHARRHIPPNTVCMSVPRRCLITVEMGQATPIGQAIYNSDLDLDAPKHIYLMIYILWDRKVNGKNSFFAPYYDILPRTLQNMPIFWSESELGELEGSYLLHQIADRNQAITEDYQTICGIAPSLSQICTLEEFKWARMCVCSRNFGLQIDGHRTSALVPHADMLNHYRPRETKWTFDEDRNAFTITTLQHIPAGAQVYDSYGQKCNHRFLLNYGFAVEENRELDGFCPNEVPLELYVDPEDSNFSEKVEFWTRGEIHHQHSQPGGSSSGLMTQTILAQAAQAMQAAESGGRAPKANNGKYNQKITKNKFFQHSNSMPLPSNHNNSQPKHAQNPESAPRSGGSSNSANSMLYSGGATVVKRVRVCVSNNENTRLLFSLLRALACNEAELRAISSPMSSSPTAGLGSTASSSDSVTRALFGFPETMRGPPHHQVTAHHHLSYHQQSHVLTGTPSPQAFFRSCRDIRHPISLRNERAAMQLLLEVVERHLSMYPTTLAQDVADLMDDQSYPPFSNKRHAKIQVRGEKEVLHHFAHWARTALSVLNVIAQELASVDEENQRLNGGGAGVEVKLTQTGKTLTDVGDGTALSSSTTRPSSSSSSQASFDYMIRRMEEDCDNDAVSCSTSAKASSMSGTRGGAGIHHTILRYCADVLGSLRREEFKSLKRLRSIRARERINSTNTKQGAKFSSGYL